MSSLRGTFETEYDSKDIYAIEGEEIEVILHGVEVRAIVRAVLTNTYVVVVDGTPMVAYKDSHTIVESEERTIRTRQWRH